MGARASSSGFTCQALCPGTAAVSAKSEVPSLRGNIISHFFTWRRHFLYPDRIRFSGMYQVSVNARRRPGTGPGGMRPQHTEEAEFCCLHVGG